MSAVIKNVDRTGAGAVVRLTGEIDLHQSPDFHQALVSECDLKPARLVIEMSGVDYIDSSGVGSLVEIYRRVKKSGGKLILVAPGPRVASVLEITKLDKFFTIAASEEEALKL
jgi:anti-sigma B factor antagonist